MSVIAGAEVNAATKLLDEQQRESDGYDSDANYTLSGVDFDEWMQEHGVLDCEQDEYMDGEYYSDSDNNEVDPADIKEAWQNACKEWQGQQEVDDEPTCINSTDEEETENADMSEILDEIVSKEPQTMEDELQNSAAVDAMMLLVNTMEQGDSYQRPPLPPPTDCELSFASMAKTIMESLERSMTLANEVATACEDALAEQATKDISVQTETVVEPENHLVQAQADWNRQKEELIKQLAEAKHTLEARDHHYAEMEKRCAGLEQTMKRLHNEIEAHEETKKALFIAHNQSASEQRRQELEKMNMDLSRQCTELKTQLALAQSREQVLLGTNKMLEAQLNDGLQLLRSKKPPANVHTKSSKRANEKAYGSSSPSRNIKRRRVKGSSDRQPLGELDQVIINAGKFAQERRHSPHSSPRLKSPDISLAEIPGCQPVTPRVNLHSAAVPFTAPVSRHTRRPAWPWKK
ncbi:hypothetical protein IWW36_003697 [Coemansia brasiliensis]|uniref:Uncharacterized protein n=1 Tax=Coemansia brasiliensis TaxID=2650707 RepID=A0A9W8I4Y1_9FUNG|nr:hypothetical protein IWW36_003697 [Coemansia brasiliensis]